MKRYLHRKRDELLRRRIPPPESGPLPPSIEEVVPDGSNVWPITPDLARLLAHLITAHATNVLELGAGSSSLVIARTLEAKGGGRLTSIEQSPEWCKAPWAKVQSVASVDAQMLVAQPQLAVSRLGVHHRFRAAIAARGPFELVLVDAPQSYFGRDGALPLVHEHLAPGALIVLDDAGRSMEQWTLFRWLRSYRSLSLRAFDPAFGGRGVAVLEFNGQRDTHFDPLSFFTGCAHALSMARERRRR